MLANYDPSATVDENLDLYLRENGFTREGYTDKKTKATIFGIDVAVPNTPDHATAIRLHDLHHVATGFGTDPIGEGEISAWELATGMEHLSLYVKAIVTAGFALGCVLAPARTKLAYTNGRSAKRNLFGDIARYDALQAMPLRALREELGLPPGGICTGARRLHARAPKSIPTP